MFSGKGLDSQGSWRKGTNWLHAPCADKLARFDESRIERDESEENFLEHENGHPFAGSEPLSVGRNHNVAVCLRGSGNVS